MLNIQQGFSDTASIYLTRKVQGDLIKHSFERYERSALRVARFNAFINTFRTLRDWVMQPLSEINTAPKSRAWPDTLNYTSPPVIYSSGSPSLYRSRSLG